MMPAVVERLQKILARAGFASRRGAEELVQEGRVTVNGVVVREPGSKADPATDDVRVDGVRVRPAATPVYIVLNKPRGVVTTRRDPAGRPTVMDLVPAVSGLFPVGRLDVTTEGLILLTNDGVFAQRVAHPRYEVARVYHAKVHRVPGAQALERLRQGVVVDGDRLVADGVRVLEGGNNAWLELTLHEGKQHEVKRMLEAVGHPVAKLRRVAIGPVVAKGLAVGRFRELRPDEVAGLIRGEGPPPVAVRRTPRRPRPPERRPDLARPAGRRGGHGRAAVQGLARGRGGRRRLGGRGADRGEARERGRDRGETRRFGGQDGGRGIGADVGRGRGRGEGRLSGPGRGRAPEDRPDERGEGLERAGRRRGTSRGETAGRRRRGGGRGRGDGSWPAGAKPAGARRPMRSGRSGRGSRR